MKSIQKEVEAKVAKELKEPLYDPEIKLREGPQHPKAMHKGDKVVQATCQEIEDQLRSEGWVDGHEFFSQKDPDVTMEVIDDSQHDELEEETHEAHPHVVKKHAKKKSA